MNTGEPVATESGHDWFGGGPSEKDQVNWHLVGGLPYRTAGSARGPGKRAGSNPSTAPRAYSAAEQVTARAYLRSPDTGQARWAGSGARTTLKYGRRCIGVAWDANWAGQN